MRVDLQAVVDDPGVEVREARQRVDHRPGDERQVGQPGPAADRVDARVVDLGDDEGVGGGGERAGEVSRRLPADRRERDRRRRPASGLGRGPLPAAIRTCIYLWGYGPTIRCKNGLGLPRRQSGDDVGAVRQPAAAVPADPVGVGHQPNLRSPLILEVLDDDQVTRRCRSVSGTGRTSVPGVRIDARQDRGSETAPGAGLQRRIPPSRRTPARQGQDAGAGADRLPARRGFLPRARPARPPPRPRLRARGAPVHGRRDHRLGHRRRAQGVRVRPGLHGLRRRPRRGVRREDPQADGPRPEGGGSRRRAQRRRRRPHPGRRGEPGELRGHLPPQRAVVGRGAADLGDPRPVRRRCRLLAGDDRLHLHGARVVAHVHHRARRREDGDRRGGHARGARRGDEPRVEIGRGDVRRRRREVVPRRRPLPALVPAPEQHGGGAAGGHRRRSRAAVPRAARPASRRAPTCPTTCAR